jgi:hypothetical protein
MSFLAPTIDVLSRTKLRLWLAGIGVAVLGVGVWVFNTQVVGVHVTECGFDAKGAYAKFRINNLLGGADARQQVWVHFSVDGSHPEKGSPGNYPYAGGVTIVAVPAHGRVTGVVHAEFPARGLHVEGRTVYVLGRKTGDVNDVRFVTEKVAQEYSRGKVSVETVPDDPGSLHCSYADDGF